jgi:hypothetical protein
MASREALERLQAHVKGGGSAVRVTQVAPSGARLPTVLRSLQSAMQGVDEVGALAALVEERASWASLDEGVRVLLVSWVVARLRAVEERGPLDRRNRAVRAGMCRYQMEHEEGYVHGLKLDHAPRSTSWNEDALRLWAELEALTRAPVPQPFRFGGRPKKRKEKPENEGAQPSIVLAGDWPWRLVVTGKRAVMVGGTPREQHRAKLEGYFGFGELAWEQAEHSRNSLQRARDRVRARGVDVVFLLTKFLGHDAARVIQPACKAVGVPFVPVQNGYSVEAMRSAIERHLSPAGSMGG